MNTSSKGRRIENLAKETLEEFGYDVVRSAASKGPYDLVAIAGNHIRLIQVKAGGYLSEIETEALKLKDIPSNSTIEFWRYDARKIFKFVVGIIKYG